MGLIQAEDVKGLLEDPELMEVIADAVVETPGVLESLADDIAEELEDEIENAPQFRKKILNAAMANPEFRKQLAVKIIEDD